MPRRDLSVLVSGSTWNWPSRKSSASAGAGFCTKREICERPEFSAMVAYADGSTLDWPLMAFASRAQDIVLYNLRGADGFKELLAACAPAKLKGSCVHVKRLADVDQKAFKALIVAAVKARKR